MAFDIAKEVDGGIVGLEAMQSEVDSEAAAHGSEGEVAALVAADVDGVAQSVTPVSGP